MKAERVEFQTPVFQDRIRGFVAAVEAGKRVAVSVGRQTQTMQRKTSRLGYFIGSVRVSVGEMHQLVRDGDYSRGWLKFRVASPYEEHAETIGYAQLLSATGVSVVSDIDDTIKHTEVTCRRSLLRNTFLREFLPISGMAELYNDWAARGAAFHYVSSSPWQLYAPLSELCGRFGFPAGTFHLLVPSARSHAAAIVPRSPAGERRDDSHATGNIPEAEVSADRRFRRARSEIYGMSRAALSAASGRRVHSRAGRSPHGLSPHAARVPRMSPRQWGIFHHADQIAERLPRA